MTDVALAIAIVSFAMFVRGFTGFGGALLTVPLLSLLWDVQLAIVVVAAMQVVTGGTLAVTSRRTVARAELVRVLVPSFAGLAAGALLLSELPVEWVAAALGVFSIVAGMNVIVKLRRVVEVRPASGAATGAAGLLAGLLQGMVGTGGPVIVPYIQRILPTAAAMRATLLAYFLALDVVRLASYVPLGVAGRDAVAPVLYLLPFGVVASLAGGRLQIQVSETLFRGVVGALLVLAGAMLLI
ncbi:MAG TPA: sulfite exporter TauE/SafE family protein [Thermomicrobiales bacterium]|nr:sulfite exporter TauE/SafE family protein [Thermomicrobiales bacterium]